MNFGQYIIPFPSYPPRPSLTLHIHLPTYNLDIFQEIEFIQGSLSQLKMAQGKFSESKESLVKLSKEATDKDILVPLTSSVSFFV